MVSIALRKLFGGWGSAVSSSAGTRTLGPGNHLGSCGACVFFHFYWGVSFFTTCATSVGSVGDQRLRLSQAHPILRARSLFASWVLEPSVKALFRGESACDGEGQGSLSTAKRVCFAFVGMGAHPTTDSNMTLLRWAHFRTWHDGMDLETECAPIIPKESTARPLKALALGALRCLPCPRPSSGNSELN